MWCSCDLDVSHHLELPSLVCVSPAYSLCMQTEEVTASLKAAQEADESHRAAVSKQLQEHARHAEELNAALEQAKAALSSQQHQALEDLQAQTQQQTAELEQRMTELQAQVLSQYLLIVWHGCLP